MFEEEKQFLRIREMEESLVGTSYSHHSGSLSFKYLCFLPHDHSSFPYIVTVYQLIIKLKSEAHFCKFYLSESDSGRTTLQEVI